MAPKSKKDPNKPKGPKSAYIYFCEAERERKGGGGFSEHAKHCSGLWADMSDEEKEEYNEMAAKDRERYNREMASYSPPEDSGSDDDGPKKKKRKKKDPNQPKRNISAYFFFAEEHRPKVKADLERSGGKPTVGDIAKEIGKKWAKLNDDAKKPYEDKAAKDRVRYQQEMAAYEKEHEA